MSFEIGGVGMQRLLYLFLLLSVLLVACNTTAMEEQDTSILYTSERTLKQNFEGVTLLIDYTVHEKDQLIGLEVTGTIQNGFSQMIYYTPEFIVETASGEQFKNDGVTEISLAPENELTFTEFIEISQEAYDQNDFMHFFVPAAFKEPGSVSSGDALGDTVWWELPIK